MSKIKFFVAFLKPHYHFFSFAQAPKETKIALKKSIKKAKPGKSTAAKTSSVKNAEKNLSDKSTNKKIRSNKQAGGVTSVKKKKLEEG